MKNLSLTLLVISTLVSASATFAETLFAPLVDNDIIVNGRDDVPEWTNAAVSVVPNGTMRVQTRNSWLATSATENTMIQPGWTLQFIWDLTGTPYNVSDNWKYNIFYFGFERNIAGGQPDQRLYWFKAWIFDDIDDPDDSNWIGESGLGLSSIDDRGFLIRPMDNPSLDVHWFPGDQEPGDPTWTQATWDHYFGFFGKMSYDEHATFEYVVNDYGDTRYWEEYGPVHEVSPCRYEREIEHWVSDPDRLLGTTTELWREDVHPVPEPGTLSFWGLGFGGLAITAHRRRNAA